MGAQADEIHELSKDLGDDHDLEELGLMMEDRPSLIEDDVAQVAISDLRRCQRKESQSRAFRQGKHIYAESPERFVGRLGAYWETARAEVGGRRVAPPLAGCYNFRL